MGRRGRRGKQLLDKEKGGYWKLKDGALDRTARRTRFGIKTSNAMFENSRLPF
jgi:hypothetical protein